MRILAVVNVMTCIVWCLLSCIAIGVGIEMLSNDTLSVSLQGETIKSGVSYFYIGAGITLALQSIATYHRKKISVVLPSLLIIFSIMALYDELAKITDGSLVQGKYISMYIVILLVCISTVYIAVNKWVCSSKNA